MTEFLNYSFIIGMSILDLVGNSGKVSFWKKLLFGLFSYESAHFDKDLKKTPNSKFKIKKINLDQTKATLIIL